MSHNQKQEKEAHIYPIINKCTTLIINSLKNSLKMMIIMHNQLKIFIQVEDEKYRLKYINSWY